MKQAFTLLLLLSLLVSSGCATSSPGRPWGFIDPEGDAVEAESVFPFEGSGTIRSSGFIKQRNWGLSWFTDGGRRNRGGNFWLSTPNLTVHGSRDAALFLFILPHLFIHIKK
jgi:hypothetical protein